MEVGGGLGSGGNRCKMLREGSWLPLGVMVAGCACLCWMWLEGLLRGATLGGWVRPGPGSRRRKVIGGTDVRRIWIWVTRKSLQTVPWSVTGSSALLTGTSDFPRLP